MTAPVVGTPHPLPDRCIWCRKDWSEVESDETHVLPSCLGNAKQQVLPKGISCKPCNNYFGSKVEPVLLKDPPLHIIAAFLGIIDPNDAERFRNAVFDREHQPVGKVNRELNIHTVLKGSKALLDVRYAISGQLEAEYSQRDLARLSQAIHKLAFEALAFSVYVDPGADLDLVAPSFDPVRRWAREQVPFGTVRPVARRIPEMLSPDWSTRLWSIGEDIGLELRLFGDWYAVSLTSPPDRVAIDLRGWCGDNTENAYMILDRFVPLTDIALQ